MEDFFKPKIIYGQFQDGAEYSFANDSVFLSSNEYLLISRSYSPKCLLAFLNSRASEWMLGNITGSLGGNSKIGQKSNFLKLPIPKVSKEEQVVFEELVDIIIKQKQHDISTDTSQYEHDIDMLIYHFYSFTEEEIVQVDKNYSCK